MNKIYILMFLVVNTFFTLLECDGSCDCCEECLYYFRNKKENGKELFVKENFEETKNENEKESFVKEIFGETKDEIVVLENGNNNNNTLSQIFSFLEGKDKEYSKEQNNSLMKQDKTFTEPETQATIEFSKNNMPKVTLKSFSFMVLLLPKKSIDEDSVKRDASLTSDLNKIEHFVKIYGFYKYSEYFFICLEDTSNFKDFNTYLEEKNVADKVFKQLFDTLKQLRESKIVKNFSHIFYPYIDDSSGTVSLKILAPIFSFKIEGDTPENFFNLFKNKYFKIAITSPQLKKHILENNLTEDYNPFNEDLFFVGIFLYLLKNKKYPVFIDSVHLNPVFTILDKEKKFKERLKKDITNFNDYFDSDDYKNHEGELYNKIFLKFKDKNDNSIIDIDEFIEKLNTNN